MRKIIGLAVLTYVLLITALVIDSYETGDLKAEYAVVLGNEVKADGQPSKRLEARLLAALSLYNENRVEKIIVSGGIGKGGYDEASVMAVFLLSNGVKSKAVVMDSNGVNTHFTSQSVGRLVSNRTAPIIVVSQQFHISRAKLSLRNAGFTDVHGYFPHYYELRDVYSYTREIIGWAKYWLLNE